MNLLVTGGCGFIGSNFINHIINKKSIYKLVNVDCLSYAGSLDNTNQISRHPKYIFEKYDLSNYGKVYDTFYKHDVTHVVHLAAETHVDNSIQNSKAFINSNVVGTHTLLEAAKQFGARFHLVSTDEVYGEAKGKKKFKESTPYNPRNPYSATKAAADMLTNAYVITHDVNATISNCCNNYGPRQHDEKLIPTIIRFLLDEDKVPVYGDGLNVRDWIYVDDHCSAIWRILNKGKTGETYLVGSDCEKTNLETISTICDILKIDSSKSIEYVEDRPGHDFRYAIDNSKIIKKLKWKPRISFRKGLEKTTKWYKDKYA
jgi:dTDP-glucose 4,6-dehydratase